MSDVSPAPPEPEPLSPRPLTSARLGPSLNHGQSAGLFLLLVVVGLTAGGLLLVPRDDPPTIPAADLAKRPRLVTPNGKPRVRYVQGDQTDLDLLTAQVDTLELKVAALEKAFKAKDTEHEQALTSAALLVTAIEAAQRHHALHGGVYGGHYRISVLVGFATNPARPYVNIVWLPLEDGFDAEAAAVANRIAGYVRAYTTRVDTVVARDQR